MKVWKSLIHFYNELPMSILVMQEVGGPFLEVAFVYVLF